ncbi:MAG TPA: hypothetical protein VGG34_04795 [Opitutaceae bacterium]|jgi:hypothetical protein
MRVLILALCVACLPLTAFSDDADDKGPVPEEIPNFNQLDEFVYVPKSTLSLGYRFLLHGPKTTFSGQGENPSTVDPGPDQLIPNISRTYIDGTVEPDQRTVTVDAGLGGEETVPIASDGRTNSWSYANTSQVLPDGNITFHTYQAEITDTADHDVTGEPNLGMELVLDRDMGKIGKSKKITWSMTAGFSIADIHSSSYLAVPTALTTITDTYDLFGQVPPSPPFTSPETQPQTVYGIGGAVNSGTTTTTATQDATQQILLGNVPLNRQYDTVNLLTTNRYFDEGAYYTLRVGPTVTIPIGSRLKLNVSAGPDIVYIGNEFNVLEDLSIATGEDFQTLYQKENSKFLPGYYVDVDLQYRLTDKAGFYLGGVYEGAGSFTQTVASGFNPVNPSQTYQYTSKLDFGDQEGLKGGMTIRF